MLQEEKARYSQVFNEHGRVGGEAGEEARSWEGVYIVMQAVRKSGSCITCLCSYQTNLAEGSQIAGWGEGG